MSNLIVTLKVLNANIFGVEYTLYLAEGAIRVGLFPTWILLVSLDADGRSPPPAGVKKRTPKLDQSSIFILPYGLSGLHFPDMLFRPDDESVAAGQVVPRGGVVVAPSMLVVRSGRMRPASSPLARDAGVGSAADDARP